MNLNDLIKRYTVKHDRKIKNLCAPLYDYLGISTFAYYTIKEDGNFAIFSNYPEQLDFFYAEKMFVNCPYLTHPSLMRSGYALIPLTPNPSYLEISKARHGIHYLFLMLYKVGNNIEGFFFTREHINQRQGNFFLNKLDLLQKFGPYFKKEMGLFIDKALSDGFNLHDAKQDAFLSRDPSLPLSSYNPAVKSYLKKVTALSSQEQKCLELYQNGYTALETGIELEISTRTVEHYFESVKNKLQCHKKKDLLKF